jgi:hypothetical protein
VTEAEGTKQAAITVAEGQKQSTILGAEGERQAAIVQAEGFALALKQIYGAAHGVDANTMTLQYFDALKRLGASPATKFVVPLELAGLLRGVTGSLDQSLANGHTDPASVPAPGPTPGLTTTAQTGDSGVDAPELESDVPELESDAPELER